MIVNKENLYAISIEESAEEKSIMNDLRDNRNLYKTSMKIALKIKRAIRKLDITQLQLSRMMGIDPAVMSRLLNGKANMELKTLVRFEEVLGIRIIDRSISPLSEPKPNSHFHTTYHVSIPISKVNSSELSEERGAFTPLTVKDANNVRINQTIEKSWEHIWNTTS